MIDDNLAGQINSAQYLYLRELSEPRDNSLRIVVEEAVSDRSRPVRLEYLPKTLPPAYPIEHIEGCRVFELHWRRYVAYLVTEEMAGSCGNDDDEVYTGKLLRQYSRSHFLDHLARDTGGPLRPLQHYRVSCLNHIIDVAAEDPPVLLVVDGETKAKGRNQSRVE